MQVLTCVGCGRRFEGEPNLVPAFVTASGSRGEGGKMCPECFSTTNALNAAAGIPALPMPPAGAWGAYVAEGAAPGGLTTALPARTAPTPQQQQIPGAAPTVQTAQGQKAASKLPLANAPASHRASQPLRRR
jgi:hypothetical protein